MGLWSRERITRWGGAAALAVSLAGCNPPPLPILVAEPTAAPTVAPSPTLTATLRPTFTPTAVPTAVPTPTATPSPTPTFEPLEPTATLAPLSGDERSELFDQAWNLVRRRYLYPDYRGVDWPAVREEFAPQVAAAETPEQFYGLMRAMIDRLGDDHTRYVSPQQVAEEEARSQGSLIYGGIGVTIRDDEGGALITRVAAGGPADEAGLQPRDLIVAIGGTPISDTVAFGPEGPEGAVRGAPGTPLLLMVRSPGDLAREVQLTRRVIPADAFPPVEARRLAGTQVGLLLIDTFEREDLTALVRDQLDDLLARGPLDGLILDVRDNGGGFIEVMLDTLGLFADGGSIGSSASRRAREELTIPDGQLAPGLEDVPIVVLIGEGTASAAEMFAAGMRARERATLIGTTSAGNTENLVLHNFSDGSRLWLAEYAYRLPDGSLIEDVGVQPDQVVEARWWRFAPEDDPQVRAALAALASAAPLR